MTASYTNLECVAIAELHPTQMTIGMREVAVKRRRWREMDAERRARFLENRSVPAVVGPHGGLYITDRHHLVRALHDEGVEHVPLVVVADMSPMDREEFWSMLESRGWTHPFDESGRRHRYNDIPHSISGLVDDPFRSLASEVRRRGGYSKNKSPFSEFRWAHFLRSRIDRTAIETNFEGVVSLAFSLALSSEAMALPGWRATDYALSQFSVGFI